MKVFSIDSKELKTRLAYYKKRFNIDISAEDYEGYIDELDKKDEIPENEEFREFVNRMEELGVSSGECIEYEDFKLEYNKS